MPSSENTGIRTLYPRAHRLPAQSTPLIGRDREVTELRRALLQDNMRLLTICGPAGIGKTRLALATAASLLDAFEHGVVFVDLAPVGAAAMVVTTISEALGVRSLGSPPVVDELHTYLADRHLLLVLDNFEQVLGATPQVMELLVACPSLKVLATSREPLHLSWEHEFPVPPLALPDLRQLPPADMLPDSPAVALFLDRVRVVNPTFMLTPDNAAVVAELCVRLDGLPLALELAAARSKVLPPEAILARMQQRMDLLAHSARDRPQRHHSLRAALDWSYDLLEPQEQVLFRSLAVFSGGCSLESAEAVAVANSATGSLNPLLRPGALFGNIASLVNKSLLRVEVPLAGEPRFGMLDTVRAYALERLVASGEAEVLHRRHTDYFVTLAEQAESELRGAQQVVWLERLEGEHDNLRVALRWCLARRAAEPGLRLGGALWRFWYMRGHFAEGGEWLTQVLALPGSAAYTAARARALNGAGNLAWNQSDYVMAQAWHTESLAIRCALGDEPGIAVSLNNLGLVAWHRADYATARDLFEDAFARSGTLGERMLQALHLNNLGNVLHDQADDAEALGLQEQSLAIYTSLGSDWGRAMALCDLGQVVHAQGDVAHAQVLCEQSLAIRRKIGDRRGIAQSHFALGQLAGDVEDYPAAHTHYEKSLALAREVGDRRGVARALEGLAAALAGQGQPEVALRLAGAAAALREAIRAPCSPSERARLDRRLGPIERAVGRDRAARLCEEGRALSPEQASGVAALALDVDFVPAAQRAPGTRDQLTPRERRTAALLAHGLTNRQIAAELVVTEGTTKLHVKHILHKLGFTSRAQIATWVVQQGLLESPLPIPPM